MMPFMDALKEFFYEGLDCRASVYLFGSAATGNWIPGRSDLDLVIIVPHERLDLLGEKVRNWAWSTEPRNPILDGYALSTSGGGHSVTRLDELVRVRYPSDTKIDLVDQWMIKNRSKHLFGNNSLDRYFPDISTAKLSEWARENLRGLMKSNPKGIVPASAVELPGLFWSISWSARMLMLSRGTICESKQEALQWLACEYPEIKDMVNLLSSDYMRLDIVSTSITSEQGVALCQYCFELLLQEIKPL
jgi:hypothetical protein